MELTQVLIDEFVFKLKKEKYKNKIQDLKLEHCVDKKGVTYIYLALIKIKKSQRNMGYGSAILFDLIQFAESYNIQIRLWASNLYGSDIKRLCGLYLRHGFYFTKNEEDNYLIYKPKKMRKNVV